MIFILVKVKKNVTSYWPIFQEMGKKIYMKLCSVFFFCEEIVLNLDRALKAFYLSFNLEELA